MFSQWDEDGIIQYLIHKVPIENKTFTRARIPGTLAPFH